MLSNRYAAAITRVLSVLALAIGLGVIVTSLIGYSLFHFHILYQDGWDFYQRIADQAFWQGLWATHNGHWLVFPALLARANLALFHANLTNLVMMGVLAQIVSAWLLIRVVAPRVEYRRDHFLIAIFVLAIMLWMGNWNALTWAFGLTYTLAVLGVVTACFCLFRSADDNISARGCLFWIGTALIGGLVASLSWGSGVVVWPILVLMALALRHRWSVVLGIIMAGLVVVGAYMYAARGVVGQAIHWPTDWSTLLSILEMLLGLLGSFPTHCIASFSVNGSSGVALFARIAGAVALAVLAWLVAMWWRRRSDRKWLLPLIGIALFVLGTGLLIGLTRTRIHMHDFTWVAERPTAFTLADRYRIFSSLLWAALLSGVFAVVAEGANTLRSKRIWPMAVFGLLLVLVPSQAHDFMRTGVRQMKAEGASLALVTGTNNKIPIEMNLAIFNPHSAIQFNPYLKRRRLSIYRQPWTHWMGTKLHGVNTVNRIMRGELIGSGLTDRGWWIKGWLAVAHRNALIVGVDHQGRIRALARSTRALGNNRRERVRRQSFWLYLLQAIDPRLPAILGWGRGWYGFVPGSVNPGKLRYFLVARDKSVIARLQMPG